MSKVKRKLNKQISRKKQRFEKLARKNKATRKASDLFLITDPKLFGEAEGTFIDYSNRKRVNVYLIPAKWSRVIMIALVYAFVLTIAKYAYFSVFGKPDLRPSSSFNQSASNQQ